MTTLVLHIKDTDISLGEASIELNRDIHAAFCTLKSYNIATDTTLDASATTDTDDFMINLDMEWAVSGRYSIQGTSKQVTGVPIFMDLTSTNVSVPDYDFPINVRRKHIPKLFRVRLSNADGTSTTFWPGTTGPTPSWQITLVFEISEITRGV